MFESICKVRPNVWQRTFCFVSFATETSFCDLEILICDNCLFQQSNCDKKLEQSEPEQRKLNFNPPNLFEHIIKGNIVWVY
jgi:hypothetical protein